jgi:tellurite resistance protein TerC
VGLAFNLIVWLIDGTEMALVWFNGYILEYLLSMDNVFFFHVVFTAYATPPSQTYKGLFLGIVGAVLLRLLFYVIGAEFFRLAFAVQVLFGFILVYSGYKTATTDEEDEDPRNNRCVIWLTYLLPLVDFYTEEGSFFTWDAAENTRELDAMQDSKNQSSDISNDLQGGVPGLRDKDRGDNDDGLGRRSAKGHGFNDEDFDDDEEAQGEVMAVDSGSKKRKLRGTMLLLVAVVLQVVDVIFAVDSVTAKIAEYDNVFINFSSSAFAMLCLRSMYFCIREMVKFFRFLKYGVAFILVLIGAKLIVAHWFDVPSSYSLATICAIFLLSLSLSALCPEADDAHAEEDIVKDGETVIGNVVACHPSPEASEDGTEAEKRRLSDLDDDNR